MGVLTKSDFKVARTCATKLYYRKLRYPTVTEGNEYMEFLADGGYMVETLARLHFPHGHEMPFGAGTTDATLKTKEAFNSEDASLFEATFAHESLMARVDILARHENSARIIEVKAKSIDTSKDLDATFSSKNGIRPEWRPYLEDVAFQVIVLRKCYPQINFKPELCLVDKSKTTNMNLLHRHFVFKADELDSGFLKRPEVAFVGDPEAALQSSFLSFVDVSKWVEDLIPELELAIESFTLELDCGRNKAVPSVGTHCKSCEFRVQAPQKSGFAECWGEMASVSPHVLDYYQVGNIGGRGAPLIHTLLAQGKAKLADVPEDALITTKGEIGATAQRQRI
ncbi:MAG: hypothetical protein RL693_910, partial [Verrucomicrobiota bacterium]